MRAEDLTGLRFGDLVPVVRYFGTYGTKRQSLWRCRCDCGTFTNVWAKSLKSGNTTSCGCARSLPERRAQIRRQAKTQARDDKGNYV
jgi:hypothetical protein